MRRFEDIPIDEIILTKIMNYLFTADKSIEDLYKIVLSHPALVYKIIITANMKDYDFQKKITTISMAIGVIEIEKVENLLLENKVAESKDKTLIKEYKKIFRFLKHNLEKIDNNNEYKVVVLHFIAAGYIYVLCKYQENYFSLSSNNIKNIFMRHLNGYMLNQLLINDVSNGFSKFFN